jgi:hypothetical protein
MTACMIGLSARHPLPLAKGSNRFEASLLRGSKTPHPALDNLPGLRRQPIPLGFSPRIGNGGAAPPQRGFIETLEGT